MADDLGLKSSELAGKLRLYGALAGPTTVINVPFSREEAQAFVDVLEYLDTAPALIEKQRNEHAARMADMREQLWLQKKILFWQTGLIAFFVITIWP